MDVFTTTVQRILEDITSAALGVNADQPFSDNTKDSAIYPYNNIIGMRSYKREKRRNGKKLSKIAVQRRITSPTL